MADIVTMLNEARESLERAAEDDNSLNDTLYYSCRATTYSVMALIYKFGDIEKELKAIREQLDK